MELKNEKLDWFWLEGEPGTDEEENEWIEIATLDENDIPQEEIAVLMVRDAAKWKAKVQADREEKADRIVACWNALRGLSWDEVLNLSVEKIRKERSAAQVYRSLFGDLSTKEISDLVQHARGIVEWVTETGEFEPGDCPDAEPLAGLLAKIPRS